MYTYMYVYAPNIRYAFASTRCCVQTRRGLIPASIPEEYDFGVS